MDIRKGFREAVNKITNKTQGRTSPAHDVTPDNERIAREANYYNRIKHPNPLLKRIQERKAQSRKRRGW